MAKEIVVLCDACQTDGGRAAAKTTLPLTVGNLGPGTLDLCDEHRESLLDSLLSLLEEHGVDLTGRPLRRRAGRPAGTGTTTTTRSKSLTDVIPAEGQFLCIFCNDTFETPSMYKGHFDRRHHMSYGKALGKICPIDGERMGNPTITNKHYIEHGVTYTGGLFLVAQSLGDPHGLVAERTESLNKISEAAAA